LHLVPPAGICPPPALPQPEIAHLTTTNQQWPFTPLPVFPRDSGTGEWTCTLCGLFCVLLIRTWSRGLLMRPICGCPQCFARIRFQS
jgi:hypothetical protein